jgi:hypothetical protein
MNMTLVRIVKGWIGPDFLHQTPSQTGIWDNIKFTFDPVDECDFLIMLNNQMKEDVTVKCPEENIWVLMQEPYMKGHSDWMIERHDPFARVFTNYIPSGDSKYIVSHPADPWHVGRSFDKLVSCSIPQKEKDISWIAGNPTDLPGHFKRKSFLNYARKDNSLNIDYFGRAIRFIEDKWDGLAPYKYSIVLQNSSSPDYWTDMLADCFLSWTVPIYYGCTNLESYFPEESFIRIDINQHESSVETIKKVLQEDSWKKRLPALEKARNLILYKYQFFPHVSNLIRSYGSEGKERKMVAIPTYKRGKKASFYRFLYKINKKIYRFIY